MKYLILTLLIISGYSKVECQIRNGEISKKQTVSDTVSRKNPIVENANSQRLDASTDTTYQYFEGDVRIYYDGIFFFSDTLVLTDFAIRAWGDVTILQGDTLSIFSDSLIYYPDSSMAYFYGYEEGSVVLENEDNQLFTDYLIYDRDREIAMYTNRGLLITPDSKLKSQRGFFHVKGKYANFYDNVTVEGDGYDILTDSLRYYSMTKRAQFLAPVIVHQEKKRIYSKKGFFDFDDDFGLFEGDAQFVENSNTSSGDKIRYDGKEKVTALLGNAKYKSDNEFGDADSIFYNQKSEKIRLEGDAIFRNNELEVNGELINYDKKTEAMEVAGRSFLSNPPYLLSAENLNYEKSSGMAFADGHAVLQDTSNNTTINADHVIYREVDEYVKAFNNQGKPVLENIMNDGIDTLYLSGDTLIGYKEYHEELDSQKVFLSHSNVEILMEGIQAICDSLSYTEGNEQFVLFDNPIMWSDSSQFSGDTIFLKLKNDKIDRVKLHDHVVIISTDDMLVFNQIAGDIADAKFNHDKLKILDVIGNAKSVYYLTDDNDAYIGANQTECLRMIFNFENNDLKGVKFYEQNKHQLTPMKLVNHEAIKLNGFNWNINSRPLTIEDLKN